jgi:hypothetical protein
MTSCNAPEKRTTSHPIILRGTGIETDHLPELKSQQAFRVRMYLCRCCVLRRKQTMNHPLITQHGTGIEIGRILMVNSQLGSS